MQCDLRALHIKLMISFCMHEMVEMVIVVVLSASHLSVCSSVCQFVMLLI